MKIERQHNIFIGFLLLLGASIVSFTANASFVGNEVLYEYIFPDIDSSFENATFVVGDGAEFVTGTSGQTVIDLTANSITIGPNLGIGSGQSLFYSSNGGAASFNGYRFSDNSGSIPAILSIDINQTTTLSGFTLDRIALTTDSIALNMLDLWADTDDVLVLDVAFVPLPASIWLFGSGLFGLVSLASARRRNARIS